ENQIGVLTSGLLELERGPGTPEHLETLMRAAHSLKGAARIVNLQPIVRLAHAMEDCFVAAQRGALQLRQHEIDLLLRAVDFLAQMSKRNETDMAAWETDHAVQIKDLLDSLSNLVPGRAASASAPRPKRPGSAVAPSEKPPRAKGSHAEVSKVPTKLEPAAPSIPAAPE